MIENQLDTVCLLIEQMKMFLWVDNDEFQSELLAKGSNFLIEHIVH